MGIKIPQITKPKWLRLELLALFAISGLVLVFTVYFSLARYLGFSSEMLDLGNMSQAVWSATQGKPLVYTSINGPLSRIAWHGELIYYLLAPLYALIPSPVTLLVFQGILVYIMRLYQ